MLTYLEGSKEEASDQQTSIVLDEALDHGDQAEQKHAHREPDVRLEFLQHHVGWDLKYNVRNKEDNDGSAELQAGELEFLLDAEDGSVRDVHSA